MLMILVVLMEAAMETYTKPRLRPSLLNLHQDTTYGGTQQRHKIFSMHPKRQRL
jgi:hypothetical protein